MRVFSIEVNWHPLPPRMLLSGESAKARRQKPVAVEDLIYEQQSFSTIVARM
jgi:hypothetical protein